jgi:hypothetical protein
MAILVFLVRFGAFYGHSVYFVVIRHTVSNFGMFYQGKSGNPVLIQKGVVRNYLNFFPKSIAAKDY